MPTFLASLLERIAPETKSIVDQTRQRFNQAVRTLLRAETRLQMSNVVATESGEEHETRSVRIFLTPGMHEELWSLSFDDSVWLAIELAPLVGLLETTHRSMDELHGPIVGLENHEVFRARFAYASDTILRMRDLAAVLLDEVAKFDLLRRVDG